jgi:hypothetical protein
MSTEVLSQTLTPGQTWKLGSGSMFLLQTAANPVNIVARQLGNSNKNRIFNSVPAGFKFTADSPDDGFDTLELTSPAGQTITIAVGTDDVTFASVVNIANIPSVQDNPAATLIDNAPVVCANTAQTAVVPQNLTRRRVTLSLALTGSTVYVRKGGGANDLLPLNPGASVEFSCTYALDIRNASGASQTVYVLEEQ